MDKRHAVAGVTLLLIFLVYLPMASGFTFKVNVGDNVKVANYSLDYSENSSIQKINLTLENTGSVGCDYRLKGEFNYNNRTLTRYSSSNPMWAGDASNAELTFIPLNYRGEVDTRLSIVFCDREKHLKNFSFNSPEMLEPGKKYNSTVLQVNSTGAEVEFEGIENATLVPQETPAYWKTGSTEVVRGEASFEYEPEIFRYGENLTYTVLNGNRVSGETTVQLSKPSPTPWDRLQENLLLILLTVSFAVNAAFILLRLEDRRK